MSKKKKQLNKTFIFILLAIGTVGGSFGGVYTGVRIYNDISNISNNQNINNNPHNNQQNINNPHNSINISNADIITAIKSSKEELGAEFKEELNEIKTSQKEFGDKLNLVQQDVAVLKNEAGIR